MTNFNDSTFAPFDYDEFSDISVLVRVRGVTFEGRDKLIRQMNVHDPVRLVPEPNNPYDPNAISVRNMDNQVLGYIPREKTQYFKGCTTGEVSSIYTDDKILISLTIRVFD